MKLDITVDLLLNANEKDYYSYFAFIMERGLRYKKTFYLWLINNMYEIFDRDPDTINEMVNKYNSIKESYVNEHVFADSLKEYFKDTYSYGECIALGLVANAFISFKENFLESDVYYEIRDMFVPFNLPISIEVNDIQGIFDIIKKDSFEKLILLNNIGKPIESEVSDELIVLALDELNFSPED